MSSKSNVKQDDRSTLNSRDLDTVDQGRASDRRDADDEVQDPV